MIKIDTPLKINNMKTGTTKNGCAYWKTTAIDYHFINDKLTPQGLFSVFITGQPIANNGDTVYIHEIQGVSAKKYRNKQGGWSTWYSITAKCGLEPLNKEKRHDIT